MDIGYITSFFSSTPQNREIEESEEGTSTDAAAENKMVDYIVNGINRSAEVLKTPEEFVKKFPHLTMLLIVVATIMYDDTLDFKTFLYMGSVPALKILSDKIDIPVINKLKHAFKNFINECGYLTYMSLFFAGSVMWGKFPPLFYPALSTFAMNDVLNANDGAPLPLPSTEGSGKKKKAE